jgi:hypothetical protein
MADDRGAVAIKLTTAAGLGADFAAAGVPDTAENRALFARIKADVAKLPPGVIPDVPAE